MRFGLPARMRVLIGRSMVGAGLRLRTLGGRAERSAGNDGFVERSAGLIAALGVVALYSSVALLFGYLLTHEFRFAAAIAASTLMVLSSKLNRYRTARSPALRPWIGTGMLLIWLFSELLYSYLLIRCALGFGGRSSVVLVAWTWLVSIAIDLRRRT